MAQTIEQYGLFAAAGLLALWVAPHLRANTTALLLLVAAAAVVVLARPDATPVPARVATGVRWEAAPAAVSRWRPQIEAAAQKCGVPAAMVAAVLWHESGGDPTIRGADGEWGLMQPMLYSTRPVEKLTTDPAYNIEWGACYLAEFYRQYGSAEEAFARYNKPAYGNQEYAAKVVALYNRLRPAGTLHYPYSRPVTVCQAFGNPIDYQAGGRHTGVDLCGREGEPILAVASGTVVWVGCLHLCSASTGRGPYAVVLDHGGGVYTTYSHNRRALVRPGERVRAGQAIAEQGNTGYSKGSHLHLELRVNTRWSGDWRNPWIGGEYRDPLAYMQ